MQTTTNYNMSKPEYSDAADIAPISGNMDTIDTALHKARTRDADLYDETTAYSVNDYCIYADTLYRCIGATTGTWDSTKWILTNLGENLTDAKKTANRAELTAVQALSVLPDPYDEETTYNVGDLCMNGALYRCIATTTGDWDSTKWVLTSLENEFERKHTWRLFETVTADGNTSRYDRTLPDNCTGVFVDVVTAAGTANDTVQAYVRYDTDTTWRRGSIFANGVQTSERTLQMRIIRDGDSFYYTEATQVVAVNGGGSIQFRQNAWWFATRISEIRLNTDTNPFPSGSVIKIYIRQ